MEQELWVENIGKNGYPVSGIWRELVFEQVKNNRTSVSVNLKALTDTGGRSAGRWLVFFVPFRKLPIIGIFVAI